MSFEVVPRLFPKIAEKDNKLQDKMTTGEYINFDLGKTRELVRLICSLEKKNKLVQVPRVMYQSKTALRH